MAWRQNKKKNLKKPIRFEVVKILDTNRFIIGKFTVIEEG